MNTPTVRELHGKYALTWSTARALLIALFVAAASLHAPAGHAGEQVLPRFVTPAGAPLPIDCSATPFGIRNVAHPDIEFADLITANGGDRELQFSQYDAKNSVSYPWIETAIPGIGSYDPLDVVGADLNGDGRDEAIVASSLTSGGVRLDVYSPDGQGGAAAIDTWQLAIPGVQGVQLVSGDFDGSMDERQEFGVLVRFGASIGLYILEGDDGGGIAQASGDAAGYYGMATTGLQNLSVAAGDVLLDGHDQIIVSYLAYGGADTIELHYHLLEYATEIPKVLPVAPGNANIGSMELVDDISNGFEYEYGGGLYPGSVDIDRTDLAIGNLVDTAAAELVTFFGYEDSGGFYHISMRLQHFDTTRDAENNITSIAFAIRDDLPEGPGEPDPPPQPFDSAIEVGEWSNSASSFDGLVANVEGSNDPDLGLAEIVLANAPSDYGQIQLYVHKVHVRLDAAFQWQSNGLEAQFHSTSNGAMESMRWDFGDGSAPVYGIANPSHTFAASGTYSVTLSLNQITDTLWAAERTFDVQIDNPGANSGGAELPYVYSIDQYPAYQATYETTTNSPGHLNVAVGDLDGDTKDEIVTLAVLDGPNILRSVWRLAGSALIGDHQVEPMSAGANLVQLDTLDFDGDSVHSTIAQDCREVVEPQLRQVVWLPPYFQRLQANADKEATFGRLSGSGTESEDRAGSYTTHSLSGYLGGGFAGAGLGGEIEIIGAATLGHDWQSSYGGFHGDGEERNVRQGFSQDGGEALVVIEENQFRCYTYDLVSQASGVFADSGVRACGKVEASTSVIGTDAVAWDTSIPAANPGSPPLQWVPLHRDWSSIALFHPVSSNAAQFDPGQEPDKATDGLFSTEAHSARSSFEPWLEVDLGALREISNVRVFPSAGQVAELFGARIVVSATPIGDPPWAPEVHVYQSPTDGGFMYNRWDAWTRDPAQPEQMLEARYVRVQLLAESALRIAEIQVFGPVHVDPPDYPDVVCDLDPDDGVFLARIWDPTSGAFREVEVHGDLLWDGTWDGNVSPWAGCTNNNEVPHASIWSVNTVGGSASLDWTLGESSSGWSGEATSFESATRVGATFDFLAAWGGAIAAGVSYEFTTGLTSETQTTSYWSHGLETGGLIEGFVDQNPEDPPLVNVCGYNPRPYAYHLTEYSVTGYRHDIYVVDYIVHQGGQTDWDRGSVPILCTRADLIFANGFE